MTNYEYLIKKYKKVHPAERYTRQYKSMIRTEQRIKNRHLILDELLLEAPFYITNAEKQRIRYMIDTYNNFNDLHRRCSEECIILAFIFFIHKLRNTKRVPQDYRICNKYGLTDRNYTLIVTRLCNMVMESQPLRGEPGVIIW